MSKARWHRLWRAGSSEAAFSARSCRRLPRASPSLGQSAAWAALAGHLGPCIPHRCDRTTAAGSPTLGCSTWRATEQAAMRSSSVTGCTKRTGCRDPSPRSC
eukprot:scaffold21900_cov67-Phaeocystis_antarctica.AAC.3